MFALCVQRIDAGQDSGSRVFSGSVRVVKLVGGQVAEVLQQSRSPLGKADSVQVKGTFHGGKLFFCPHGPVLFDPRGAFVVPDLHGGQVVARQGRVQDQRLGIGAFSTGGTAQNQRQHCGVYGVMPPSAKE